MESPCSELPPGWTVERKNGKRDKFYFSPASGLKFNSKVEVFRHVDNAQNKISIQRVTDNVVVEKGIAEGLPPGWMRKTRVTTKGATVRRDSYYIDPVSGYAFRSIRDVDRYLESGEIGRNTFKPKDRSDMKLKADDSSSVDITATPTLSASTGPSSDLDMIANDKLVQKPAWSGAYVSTPVSENISTQCVVSTELASIQLQAEGSNQKEGKVGLTETTSVPGFMNEESQEKKLQENEQPKHVAEKSQVQQRKRRKRVFNLPRRSSKRLAGIQIDPVPELITRSHRRRATVKQSAGEETVRSEDKYSNSMPNAVAKQTNALEGGSETKCKSESTTTTVESPKSCQSSRHMYGEFSTPEWVPEKTKEEHGSNKDQECFSFWPQENNSTMKDNMRVIENGDKVGAMLDHYSHEFPLRELLKDQCIAFAVQILTGVTFDTSKTSKDSAEPRNSEHFEIMAAAEGYGKGKQIKGPNMGDDKGYCNMFPHSENYGIPQEHAGDAGVANNKASENSGSSSEKALDILHMDPCIEFAIKTLTGTIPLDSQQNPKNCIQQQLSSSNSHHGEMALPSVSLENIRQTDYYPSQNFGTQKAMFNQTLVDPALQHTRNVGIGSSAGARIPHYGEDRRNV